MPNTAVYKQADGFTTEFEDMREVQKDIRPAAERSEAMTRNPAGSRDLKRE